MSGLMRHTVGADSCGREGQCLSDNHEKKSGRKMAKVLDWEEVGTQPEAH